MKEKTKKVITEMMYELQDRVKGRMMFAQQSALPENEIKLRVTENENILKILDKIIDHKINPIKSIETVRGVKYEIGDTFCINGNVNTKYKIEYFPDSVTVRGISKNPEIGQAWTVEAYIENIFKPKKEKVVEVKEEKRKSVEIKVGEYFAVRTNNTVYKATRVKTEKVFGENELKAKNAPKVIGALRTDIILKTKKDYKKQHKAERKFKE
jgi:hypothetical protein